MRVVFELPDGENEVWITQSVPRVGDWVMLGSQPVSYRVKRLTWFFPLHTEAYVTVEFE